MFCEGQKKRERYIQDFSSHTDELEPIGTAILLEEEFLAVGEAARSAPLAFGRVGAVEIGYVLVADVAEPGLICYLFFFFLGQMFLRRGGGGFWRCG